MKFSQHDKERAEKVLRTLKGKKKVLKVFARVNSVSRSGMSRRIEIYTANGDDITRIGWYIAALLDYPYDIDKGGIRADGCGMDMIYSILSNLNYKMMALDNPGKNWHEVNAIVNRAAEKVKAKQGYVSPAYHWYFVDCSYGSL